MLTILQTDSYDSMGTAAAAGIGIGAIIFGLIIYLFVGFCLYKIFQKAGVENAWGAFIPIYNYYLLTEVVKVPWWWTILCCIPYLNFLVFIYLFYRLSKFFGKDWVYVILIFLVIGYPLLAFGDAKYDPNALPDERNK